MNLPRSWVTALQAEGLHVRHWSDIGDKTAPDDHILMWARNENHIVLTLDLDFQQLLFATPAAGPSVVLLRVRDPLAPSLPGKVRRTILDNAASLQQGCLVVMDEIRSRLRRLPLVP